jgi:uncharacterized protein YeaO (DUF488 family)
MKTSYFYKIDRIIKDDKDAINPSQCISIARSMPQGTNCKRQCSLLAPSQQLLNEWKKGHLTWEAYESAYIDEIAYLSPKDVYDSLITATAPLEPILLCWEGPSKPCHRHTLAKWLKQALNIRINEL